jgi:hypothetical protein
MFTEEIEYAKEYNLIILNILSGLENVTYG